MDREGGEGRAGITCTRPGPPPPPAGASWADSPGTRGESPGWCGLHFWFLCQLGFFPYLLV